MTSEADCYTISDLLRHYARTCPQRTALEFKSQSMSYARLDAEASALAGRLQDFGAVHGERVVFLGRNSDLYFHLLFACARRGAIFVPLNWRLSAHEILEILIDCEPRVTFVCSEFSSLTGEFSRRGGRIVEFRMDPLSGAHDLGATLDARRGAAVGKAPDTALGAAPSAVTMPSPAQAPAPLEAEDVVVILYTSGTTGRPKGVQLSNRSLLAPRRAEYQLGQWTHWRGGEDRLFAIMPLFHIGCLSSTMMAFRHGCTVFVIEQVEIDLLLHEIGERRLTHGLLVPTVLNAMLASPQLTQADLSSLKLLMYGGSPIGTEALAAMIARFRCAFAQGYGMTEVGGSCIFLEPSDHDTRAQQRLLSIGRPGATAELDIRDARGEPVMPGEVGEIWIRSVGLMTGYWRRPDEEAAVLRGSWYRSGDAGYRDADGYYFLTDRFKDMIVTGGENVYPVEVERVLLSHAALADVAVIGIPSDQWGESVHAICVAKPDSTVTAADLIGFTRGLLAGFKVPKSVEFVAALPRNAFGKVPKYQLREPYWAGLSRRVN